MVTFITNSLLIITLIGWLIGFLNCYTYYSQTDFNRIKFKSWTIISFLSMLNILMHLFILNNSYVPLNVYFSHFIGIADIMLYVFYADFVFTTNYSLQDKNFKIKRYSDILLELTVFFIVIISFVLDAIYFNAIALLIIILVSAKKRIHYCFVTSVFYTLVEASKCIFSGETLEHCLIFSICGLGVVMISLLRIDQLKKIEMNKQTIRIKEKRRSMEIKAL